MSEQKTEVVGTVRNPDGVANAEIDGLVIVVPGGLQILSKPDAIAWAMKGLLWCRTPGAGNPVAIEAVDRDGDGRPDYVHTKPDHTRTNNLLHLDIWDRQRNVWLDWQGRVKAA